MAVKEAPTAALAPEPERGRFLDWLTTTDHKKIGLLYLINSFAFFAVAGLFALLMRTELARPGTQIFAPHAYNQLFTLHGTLMIFLVIFPLLAGFGNYFVPLQIGALDMAFPRINALSFWLLPAGGLTILAGFLTHGGAAAAGWTGYPPLAEQLGTGQDLWIVGPDPRRHRIDPGGHQLRRDDPSDAGARYDDDADARVHVEHPRRPRRGLSRGAAARRGRLRRTRPRRSRRSCGLRRRTACR